MTEECLTIQALAQRLAKLEEHKSRRRIVILLLIMIFCTGGFSIATVLPPKAIIAENISLVDNNGITRLKMELKNGTPQITMAYENGDPCLRISMGELVFYDQGKKPRINLLANNIDSSSLSITDRVGKNCVTLSAGPEGPYLSIDDNDEKKEVILSIDPIGTLNGVESSSGKR